MYSTFCEICTTRKSYLLTFAANQVSIQKAMKESKQHLEEEEPRPLYYTKKEPRKAFSTYLRNQNKGFINSVNMVDRKAAIMIRVNSTIISAIIIFFDRVSDIPFGIFIGITMVVCSFTSLMFAINASRPNLFSILRRGKQIQDKYPNLEETLFSVGANSHVSLEEYEAAYDKLIKSQELQVGAQVRTMYLFEKQTQSAFAHIEFAYLSFMIGFSVIVIAFVLGNLYQLL
jgi:hypothetical protein